MSFKFKNINYNIVWLEERLEELKGKGLKREERGVEERIEQGKLKGEGQKGEGQKGEGHKGEELEQGEEGLKEELIIENQLIN